MTEDVITAIRAAILEEVPEDGSSIGNIRLREQVAERIGSDVTEADYVTARDALVSDGRLAKGRGRELPPEQGQACRIGRLGGWR